GGRVSLPADPLASSLPVRGDPPAPTRRADRAADALQARAVPLPGTRHEPAAAADLWRFYNYRASVELLVRQLKGDYALGSIPTRYFFANETQSTASTPDDAFFTPDCSENRPATPHFADVRCAAST